MKKQTRYLVLLLVLAFSFVIGLYQDVLLSPNSFMFGADSGDAMKNYYTYAHFIKNNESNIEFEGMNYPYYEHFVYTDCHPFQASVLKWLNQYLPIISDYSVGILNLAMILSIVLTVLILYLIFVKLEINRLLSVFSALAITILSPQVFRFLGHFALSYAFFIPLTIYLLLLFDKKQSKKYLLFLLLSTVICFFTHPYLGMIASSLALVLSSVGLIRNYFLKKSKTEFKKHFQVLLISFVPVISFFVFMKLTDTHIGRVNSPWGIYEAHSELACIFLPVSGYFNIVKQVLFPHAHQPWEGWAYIGLVAIVALVFYIIGLVRKKSLYANWTKHYFLNNLFIAAIFFLFLSTLLPFRSLIYYIIDHVDIIKQFRSIGRFAWIFFFSINILAVFLIDKLILHLKERRKKNLANILLVLLPLIIAIEGFSYHTYVSKKIKEMPNLFSLEQNSDYFKADCEQIDTDKYQAIVSLPFFYIGSENFGKQSEFDIYPLSFLFSYHLNLPLVNSFLVRTGIPESKKIMQMMASNFYKKEIEKDLKSDKPFLILSNNGNMSVNDKQILDRAKLLIKREDYSFYEIEKSAFFENTAQLELEKFRNIEDSLFKKEQFLVTDTNLIFKYIDFDNLKETPCDEGVGCFEGIQKNYNILYSFKGSEFDATRQYTGRFWMYNNGENYGQNRLSLMVFFARFKDGKEVWLEPSCNPRTSHEISGNWSLAEISLSDIDADADYKLIIKGDSRSDLRFYVDNFLFYDNQLDIYKLSSDKDSLCLFHNNQRIVLPLEK